MHNWLIVLWKTYLCWSYYETWFMICLTQLSSADVLEYILDPVDAVRMVSRLWNALNLKIIFLFYFHFQIIIRISYGSHQLSLFPMLQLCAYTCLIMHFQLWWVENIKHEGGMGWPFIQVFQQVLHVYRIFWQVCVFYRDSKYFVEDCRY